MIVSMAQLVMIVLTTLHCTTVCQDLGVTLDTVQVTNQKHEVKINMLWVNGGKKKKKKLRNQDWCPVV